jgi:hypothetical protein
VSIVLTVLTLGLKFDTDERLARLEKLMGEARVKPAEARPPGPAEVKGAGKPARAKSATDAPDRPGRQRSKRG